MIGIIGAMEVEVKNLKAKIENKKTEFLMDLQNQYKFEIHEIPSLKRPVAQVKEVMKIIKENNYNITYFNVSEASNILGLDIEEIDLVGAKNKDKLVSKFEDTLAQIKQKCKEDNQERLKHNPIKQEDMYEDI